MTRGSSRWLLLGSLALNLFFIGVAVAHGRCGRAGAVAIDLGPRRVRAHGAHRRNAAAADAGILRAQIDARPFQLETAAQSAFRATGTASATCLRQRAVRCRGDARRDGAHARRRQGYDQIVQSMFADSCVENVARGPARARQLAAEPKSPQQGPLSGLAFSVRSV